MKNTLIIILAATLSLGVAACKNKQKAAGEQVQNQDVLNIPENVFLEVKTEPCYGECPVYTLTIFQDSTVKYNGRMFTKKSGRFAGKAKAEHIEQIKNALKKADFFNMDRVYDDPSVTDLPTTTVSARIGDRQNKVRARYNEPKSFTTLSNFIFEFIDELPLAQVETK